MFIKLALFLTSIILSLLILECYANTFLKIEYQTVEMMPDVFDEELRKNFKIYDSALGFKPGPTWVGENGIFGFQNGREYINNSSDNNKDINIALLGDSIIQDLLLMKAFKYLLKGKPYKIWNAGIGGYNTIQEAYYLEREVKIVPEILILCFCLNDFIPSLTIASSKDISKKEFTQQLVEPLGYASPFLFKHSALYRYFLLKRINLVKKDNIWSVEAVLKNRDVVKNGLNKINKLCVDKNIIFLVIVYPHLQDYLSSRADWLEQSHSSIIEILEGLKIKYIDLHDKYKSIGYDKLKQKLDDIVHPNYEGHFISAKEIINKFYLEFGLKKEEVFLINNGSYVKERLKYN